MEQTNNRPLEIEVFNKIKGSYIVRYDYNYIESTEENPQGQWTYEESIFDNKPTFEDLKEMITSYYNKKCDQEIIQGFYFEEYEVWLTTENQFNYKVAWDLAFQTNGANLPSTFKFGTNEKPIYRVFETVSDLQDFYVKSITYIENVLKKYWLIKDGIEWDKYIIE